MSDKRVTITGSLTQWTGILAALSYAEENLKHPWTRKELSDLATFLHKEVLKGLEDKAMHDFANGLIFDIKNLFKAP